MQKIPLLTNNLDKLKSLRRYGIEVVERVALKTAPTRDNICYLRAKREKLGHLLNLAEVINDTAN